MAGKRLIYLIALICIGVLLVSCSNKNNKDTISDDGKGNISVIGENPESNTQNNNGVSDNNDADVGQNPENGSDEIDNAAIFDEELKISNIRDFIPAGYKAVKVAKGDMNKDGISDMAVIADEENVTGDFPGRILLILFKGEDGKYSLSARSDKAVLKRGEGGVASINGEPLNDMRIENGVLIFDYYGGSRERWNLSYRFRFENNNWVLIRANEGWEDSLNEEGGESKSFNLVTGKGLKTTTDKTGKVTQMELEGEPGKYINLADFEPRDVISGIIKPKEIPISSNTDTASDKSGLVGSWSRTGDLKSRLFETAVLEIEKVEDNKMKFILISSMGANMGEIDGEAVVSGNEAVFNGKNDSKVIFRFENSKVIVKTNEEVKYYAGAGVSFDGEYEKDLPDIDFNKVSLIELGIVDTKEQEDIFKSLVGDRLDIYINSAQIKSQGDDLDKLGAEVRSFYVRGLAQFQRFIVMFTKDNKFYTAVINGDKPEYFTNDEKYKNKMPKTIKEWIDLYQYN